MIKSNNMVKLVYCIMYLYFNSGSYPVTFSSHYSMLHCLLVSGQTLARCSSPSGQVRFQSLQGRSQRVQGLQMCRLHLTQGLLLRRHAAVFLRQPRGNQCQHLVHGRLRARLVPKKQSLPGHQDSSSLDLYGCSGCDCVRRN